MLIIFRFILLLVALFQSSAGQAYIATGSSEWNSEWWLNDQPAFVGHGAYGVDVSRFVINGKNKATLKLSQIPGSPFVRPTSKIVVSKDLFDKGREIWSYSTHDFQTGKVSFEFEADRTTRWTWESAEKLQKEDDVRNAVTGMASVLAEAIKKGTEVDFIKIPLGQWQKIENGSKDREIANEISLLKSIDKSTVEVINKDQFKIRTGTKLVLVYSDLGPLIKAKAKINGVLVTIVIEYIYFFKKKEKWIMLFP